MLKRAILFSFLSSISGAILGAISAGAFVQNTGGGTARTVLVWAVLGVVHGLVLFFCSLGDSPVIEDTRASRYVSSSLANSFDYRRFGHCIPYIAAVFGLILALAVSPLLCQGTDIEMRSAGIRLIAGFVLSFLWTGVSMLISIVVVSKVALK